MFFVLFSSRFCNRTLEQIGAANPGGLRLPRVRTRSAARLADLRVRRQGALESYKRAFITVSKVFVFVERGQCRIKNPLAASVACPSWRTNFAEV